MTRLLALAAALALVPATALASPTQESLFQDDNMLEFAEPLAVERTMNTIKRLGADRIRLSVFWAAVAPNNASQVKPAGFDPSNPNAYPPGAWDRYDTFVKLARERGLAVLFNITGPAPKWATPNPARADIDQTYDPNATEFAAFVTAVGARYSGSFTPGPSEAPPGTSSGGGGGVLPPIPGVRPPGSATGLRQAPPADGPLPRVDHWEIWNEPNQAGWLTPQWRGEGNAQYEAAPSIYRGLAGAMFAGLHVTGHGNDVILLGSTAPKGLNVRGETRSIKPLHFIRQMYCLDDNLQPLRGQAAKLRGCPESDQIKAFPAAHPGLFLMTGWAHHPYELTFAPNRRPTDPDYATMGNLGQLSSLLRRIYQRYAKPLPHKRGVPLYLTEFGYQTNPPDRLGVSPVKQAAYLDQAEYMAWRNRLVRAHSQFLLNDGGEPVSLTFQSGLRYANGRAKPAMSSYRLPIHLPRRSARRGARITVWGLARTQANGTAPRVAVQFRRKGSKGWRTVVTRTGTKARGYVTARIRVTSTGHVRLRHGARTSRVVSVRIR